MADTDCVDWKITERLVALLATIKVISGYKTDVDSVVLMGAEVTPATSKRILVCPNESDPEQEYMKREDTIPFVLIYSDGLNESGGTSYIERYKNVGADIQKCIKTNPTLYKSSDGKSMCQDIVIQNVGYTVVEGECYTEEVCYLFVNVQRTIDNTNPYQTM